MTAQENLIKAIAELERERCKDRVATYMRVGRKEQLLSSRQEAMLAKLNSLYSVGILTDEEYAKGRERILGDTHA